MKILFIMYSYLPQGSAEVNLITKISKILKEKNVVIDILTTKSNVDQKNISIIDDSKVFRINYGRNYSIKRTKCSLFKKIVISIDKLLDLLSCKIYNKSFLNKYLVKKIKKSFKKYKLFDYDLYIPVSGYFEMYEATKKALHKYKKEILLYQLDPIINNTAHNIKTLEHRKKFEFLLSTECSGIISTEYLINQKKDLNIDIKNCYSFEFPNIDKSLNDCNTKKHKRSNVKLALFAGNLSLNIRDPRFVFELFSKLGNDIKLQIAGSGCGEIIQEYLNAFPDKFEYLGILNAEEIKQRILDADFLVNIGNNHINFVPSKIFEYISTGKPIINSCKYDTCPTIEYLSKYFDNSISLIETTSINDDQLIKINEFIRKSYGVHISYDDIYREYEKYTDKYIGNGLYELFLKKQKNDY